MISPSERARNLAHSRKRIAFLQNSLFSPPPIEFGRGNSGFAGKIAATAACGQQTKFPPQAEGVTGSAVAAGSGASSAHSAPWNLMAFFFDIREAFLSLLTGSSDCATLRKAEFKQTVIRPEPRYLLSDRLTCSFCNVQTRSWKVAQFNRFRECVCVSCWSEYLRLKGIFPAVAKTGNAGVETSRTHASKPRRYTLKPLAF